MLTDEEIKALDKKAGEDKGVKEKEDESGGSGWKVI